MTKIPPEWENTAKYKVDEILNEFFESNAPSFAIPIQEVIETFIVDVHFVTSYDPIFPDGVSAFTTRDRKIGWLVVINGRECVERQRFSAAHELGHMVLLKNQSKTVHCSDDNGWDERLCDFFAGHMLMPEKLVRAYCRMFGTIPVLEDIAKMFKVSKQVAQIQLDLLGLPFKTKEIASELAVAF